MHSILLSGEIASGKSSVGRILRDEYKFDYRAFGDLVRKEAVARKLSVGDRDLLQDLGQELFTQLGPLSWAQRLIDGANEPIAVDGVRHMSVRKALETALPGAISIFLTASPAVLRRRRAERGDDPAQSRHPVEHDSLLLRDSSDLIVDTSNRAPGEIAVDIVSLAQCAS